MSVKEAIHAGGEFDPGKLLTPLTLRPRKGTLRSEENPKDIPAGTPIENADAAGSVTLPNRLVLAPMAGVSDLPFRVLCHEMGAGLVCTEMVSAKAITYRNRNTAALMRTDPSEHPVSLQLFGSEPEVCAQAFEMIREQPFEILDFNMGCPVPKVVGNGEGSALMKNPERIYEIVRALTQVSDRPVTVKIRRGFDEAHVNAVEAALAAQEGGAAAVAVHGRTREQYYAGQADRTIIAQVKEALDIPVFGNGDIFSPQDAAHMVWETGCDGVMIARGARGNPWIFRETIAYLQSSENPAACTRPDGMQLKEMILRHARMQAACKGEFTGLREMRKHVAWYTTGWPRSARLRAEVNEVETYAQLEKLLTKIFG